MDEFEKLLSENYGALDRYVKFKIGAREDAEDIFQEVCLAASQSFSSLHDTLSFKSWIISIAKNKINDYYRKMAKRMEIPIDALNENVLAYGRNGISETTVVRDTLDLLGEKDKQMLYLFYFCDMPQSDIARRLKVPVGTVKSRLFAAREKFKEKYPYQARKEKKAMKKIPEIMPDYKIERTDKKPFEVKWEELMGWFLVPKLGEKLSWGMYDIPSRKCSHVYDMQVKGKAKVHGIEGVELTAREASYSNENEVIDRTFVAQLTDTHCRYLATLRNDYGVRNYITFLDGDEFMQNWGFGEDNCGNETNLSVKGEIKRTGNTVTSVNKDFLLDIVGRYTVTIGGIIFDTICVMDIETYDSGVVSEQYLDKNGRTVLWRRFNRDDWAFDRYKKKWTEILPENERITVNGKTYVHWYDCITDYIL